MLIVRDDRQLEGGRYLVCVDGSAYGYKAMRVALELAREFGGKLFVASAFDVEYHHVVFHNIKDVLSVQASKVFKFEEQEELHNNIIDKGLLRLCQANLKRAEVMAGEYPDVEIETQILIGSRSSRAPVGGGDPAFAPRRRASRPSDRGDRSRLAGRQPDPARAGEPAARRHDRGPSRGRSPGSRRTEKRVSSGRRTPRSGSCGCRPSLWASPARRSRSS